MATYNGANYLLQQLESLAEQTYPPFELVICDDNSSDNTLEILSKFSQQSPFPVVIQKNEHNIGPIANFFRALSLCKGDWISFCDQDDIWLKHKLLNAVSAIRKSPQVVCILQYATIVDSNLNPYSSNARFPRLDLSGTKIPNSLPIFFEWHGFLTTFKKSILSYLYYQILPLNIHTSYGNQSHDQWVSFISRIIGNVEILPEISAYYRRHPAAVTGSYTAEQPRRPRIDGKSLRLRRLTLCSASYRRYCIHSASKSLCLEHRALFLTASRHYYSYERIAALKYFLLTYHCSYRLVQALLMLLYFETSSFLLGYPSASFSAHKYIAILSLRLINHIRYNQKNFRSISALNKYFQ